MAYDINQRKILAPVSVYDVQRCFGTSRNDVGDQIANVAINKWAKYKPVVWANVDTVSTWDPVAGKWTDAAQWWKSNGNCGLSITPFTELGVMTNTNSFLYKLTHGLLGWSYIRPTGGGSAPYRLTDFARYFHEAIAPYGEIGHTEIYVDQQGQATIAWDVVDVDEDNLKLTDIIVRNDNTNHPLTDFYLGAVLYKPNYSTWYTWTSDVKFGGGDLTITLTDATGLAGDWKLMPFFSLKQNVNEVGLFVSFADIVPIDITLTLNGSNYIDLPEGMWNQAGSAVNFEVDLVNETSVVHNYTSLIVTVFGGSYAGDTLGQLTVGAKQVAARSRLTVTGTVAATKSGYSSYWIVVRDGTSGTTIRQAYNQIEDWDGPID